MAHLASAFNSNIFGTFKTSSRGNFIAGMGIT